MPNWQKGWQTGKPMTLLEAFGISKEKFTFPQLNPSLPGAAAAAGQTPMNVNVQGGGGSSGNAKGSGKGGGGVTGGGPSTGGPPASGPVKLYAKKLLTQHGWTNASEWISFNSIVMHESGWNPKIPNGQGSGAFGIAQALGHGGPADRGTLSDAYGGFGLTHTQARAANSGNPYWQLVWMCNYIASVYGDPNKAWQHWQANQSY